MTTDNIIAKRRLWLTSFMPKGFKVFGDLVNNLVYYDEHSVRLALLAEREECAKIAESIEDNVVAAKLIREREMP